MEGVSRFISRALHYRLKPRCFPGPLSRCIGPSLSSDARPGCAARRFRAKLTLLRVNSIELPPQLEEQLAAAKET